MATLGPDSKRRLEIHISDVAQPVQVEIDVDGFTFWIKGGNRKRLTLSWHRAVLASQTPYDVKSYLAGRPVEFLKSQVK